MPNKQGPLAGETWVIKGLCRFATVTQWALRDEPEGNLQTCTAAKKFPRYFPGRGLGAGELTARENWKVKRAHAGVRRSLSAPAAPRAGATGAGRAQAPLRRRAPLSTAWLPPSGPPPGSSPELHLTNEEELPSSQFQKPRPGPARRQPMGGRAQRPVRAARAEPAQSEKSEPNPSGPPLRTHRLPPRAARRRLLPPDRVYCPNPKVQFGGPAAASERDDTGVRQVSEARVRPARARGPPHLLVRRRGFRELRGQAGWGEARGGHSACRLRAPGLPGPALMDRWGRVDPGQPAVTCRAAGARDLGEG